MSDGGYVLPMWEDPATVASFVRWHAAAIDYYRLASEALLAAAGIAPGVHMLDVGTGTGIPALQAAQLVGPEGKVVATDPSAALLAAAEANAREAGVANIVFNRAPAESLPFPDASFDAVVSQLGLMFVADLSLALAEARRVLRPGGRAAFLAWGPYAENPHWASFWEVVERYAAEIDTTEQSALETSAKAGDSDPPDAATPGTLDQRFAAETDPGNPDETDMVPDRFPPDPRGPFRFAAAGTLVAALEAAGFATPREETLRVPLSLPDPLPIAAFWWGGNATYEALPLERQHAFRNDVLTAYRGFAGDDGIAVPAVFVLGVGMAR